ncbi:MAG: transposase [Deltaproteobacteria bacterium HGW-Deltaproteobacteria-12]|jgi:putative transposase|nr:MAG: transposase [Deltaproteobacteria bacterium HGW-Deltaproteobacteria-12]
MARISRIVAVEYPHHITQRGVRSMDIFKNDSDRNTYLQFIKEETQRCEIDILAWCLMTNHVHFVALPHTESSLARGFGEAHKRYTRMKNFQEGVRGYLFQGRFGSCVLDERHLLAAVRYVENNPVAAGIVKHAWEYPWSSAAYHVGNIEDDVLVKDRSLYGLVNDWRIYLGEEENDIFNTIRKATRTGRPAGDNDFTIAMENRTGRVLRQAKAGRKKKQS